MANEGSTKPTYSDGYKEGLLQKRVDGELDRQRADFLQKNVWELEAELARVRGLLQRLMDAVKSLEGTPIEYRLAMELASLLKQGAESVDIGKLDTADKNGESR